MGIQERKEREKERRRQQIMVAAKRVFSIKGYNKTTMEDIARDAELSPGTIYLYFKNKDELYASISLRVLHYMLIRMEHVMAEQELDIIRRLENIKEALYDVYEFDPLLLLNIFHLQSSDNLDNLSPELLSEINDLSEKSINTIAVILEDGIKKGVFIKKKAGILSEILWSMFSGIVLGEQRRNITDRDRDRLRRIFDTAFEIFVRGIVIEASE